MFPGLRSWWWRMWEGALSFCSGNIFGRKVSASLQVVFMTGTASVKSSSKTESASFGSSDCVMLIPVSIQLSWNLIFSDMYSCESRNGPRFPGTWRRLFVKKNMDTILPTTKSAAKGVPAVKWEKSNSISAKLMNWVSPSPRWRRMSSTPVRSLSSPTSLK